MHRSTLLPLPLLLALSACLPDLPDEKDGPAPEGSAAGQCADGADNDEDGIYDCEDPDCAAAPDCSVEPAPPEGLAVAISPSAPVDEDDLSCGVFTEAVDPNGDAVTYSYAWTVDGVDAERDTDTVPAVFTSVGQSWTCTVTPSDGTLTGTPASASVTIASASSDVDGDGFLSDVDCDDQDAAIHPGAVERCATLADDDCDGTNNDQDAEGCRVVYEDADGDGAGNAAVARCRCEALPGEVDAGDDCDDTNGEVSPGASESCDARDQDCDGEVDEEGVCDDCHTAVHDGSNYVFCGASNRLGWDAASAWCSARGYSPVVIESEAENAWIRDEAIAYSIAGPHASANGVRIGLRDSVSEGTFAWWDGRSVTYTNWFGSRINNDSNDCVELYTYYPGRTMGEWNIFTCDAYPFVCEALAE